MFDSAATWWRWFVRSILGFGVLFGASMATAILGLWEGLTIALFLLALVGAAAMLVSLGGVAVIAYRPRGS